MSGYLTGLAHGPAGYFATVGARLRKGLLGEGGARTSGACGEMKRGGGVGDPISKLDAALFLPETGS